MIRSLFKKIGMYWHKCKMAEKAHELGKEKCGEMWRFGNSWDERKIDRQKRMINRLYNIADEKNPYFKREPENIS
jgi:hypothetical protein